MTDFGVAFLKICGDICGMSVFVACLQKQTYITDICGISEKHFETEASSEASYLG